MHLLALDTSTEACSAALGVCLPGEPERAAREQRTREGITIDDATWLEIVESCKKVGAQT